MNDSAAPDRPPDGDARRYFIGCAALLALAGLLQVAANNVAPPPVGERVAQPSARLAWDRYTEVAEGEAPGLIRGGHLPWWAHPGLRIAPLRPIASLVDGSLAAAPNPASTQTAFTWLCWLTLCSGVALLAREVLPAGRALLALAVFLGARGHWMLIGGRDSVGLLLALTLGALGLWAQMRGRRRAEPPWRALGLSLFALALLAHEHTLALLPLFVVPRLLDTDTSLARRIAAITPWVGLCVGRVVWSLTHGYGCHEALRFADPLGAPVRVWESLQRTTPALLAESFWGVPMDPTPLTLGWALAGLVAVVLLRSGRRRASDGLLLGACFTAVAAGIGPFRPELALLPKLGIAIGIAELVRRDLQRPRWIDRTLVGLPAIALLVGNLFVSPALSISQVRDERAELAVRMDQAKKIWGDHPSDVVVLSAAKPASDLASPFHLASLGRPVLSVASGPQFLRRVGPRTIELETTTAGIYSGTLAYQYSASGPGRQHPGDTFTSPHFAVTVEAVNFDGPTRLRVQFARDLDENGPVFVRGTREGFERVRVPPQGQEAILPAANPAFGELNYRE